ncbi:MAG: penicillin-binding protein 2 [Coriobacteriia bacterium]|nr:penicillin-binding protein 2 [Coriobacteriia bacterium]
MARDKRSSKNNRNAKHKRAQKTSFPSKYYIDTDKKPSRFAGSLSALQALNSSRLALALAFLLILVLLMVGRLAFIQIFKHSEFTAMAQEQRTRNITMYAKRGTIYDRSGNILAKSVDAETIYANPKEITDEANTVKAILPIVGGDEQVLLNRVNDKTKTFVYIAKKVDPTQADELRELNLSGIYFLPDTKRVYPYGDVAGQIIGAVGTDNIGLSGLELYYDEILSGVDGELLVERGRNGYPIAGGVKKEIPAINGEDIVLSVDIDIQKAAQESIAQAAEQWSAISVSTVVANPKTGEILAMASTPFLDPNNLSKAKAESFKLRPISEVYEPGSTFKALSAAFAVDSGASDINKHYSIGPSIKVGDHNVTDDFEHGYIDLTLREILINSSNIGAVLYARETGSETFYEYLMRFELNRATGIDYKGESSGILKTLENWDGSSLGSISFGQGISVTPIQLVRALSAIANDGLLRQPHFLVSRGGQNVKYPEPKRVIKSTTAEKISDALTSVVDEGTGENGALPGYKVAGKTGTAQRVLSTGGYAKNYNTASFAGFAPSDDPQVVVYVVLDGVAGYGSSAAAPVCRDILAVSLKRLDIAPTDRESFNSYEKEQSALKEEEQAAQEGGSED